MTNTAEKLAKTLQMKRPELPADKAKQKAESFDQGMKLMMTRAFPALAFAAVFLFGVLLLDPGVLGTVAGVLAFLVFGLVGAWLVFQAGHMISGEAADAAAKDLGGFGGVVGKLLRGFKK